MGLLRAYFMTSEVPKGFSATTRLGENFLLVRNRPKWIKGANLRKVDMNMMYTVPKLELSLIIHSLHLITVILASNVVIHKELKKIFSCKALNEEIIFEAP